MHLELTPYVAASPLLFGMSAQDTEALLGPPISRSRSDKGEPKYLYRDFNLAFFPAGGLGEVSVTSRMILLVGGQDIFRHGWPMKRLLSLDAHPLEYVGFLFFPKLGILTTGFHTDEDKTVTAVANGWLDALLPKFNPYNADQR